MRIRVNVKSASRSDGMSGVHTVTTVEILRDDVVLAEATEASREESAPGLGFWRWTNVPTARVALDALERLFMTAALAERELAAQGLVPAEAAAQLRGKRLWGAEAEAAQADARGKHRGLELALGVEDSDYDALLRRVVVLARQANRLGELIGEVDRACPAEVPLLPEDPAARLRKMLVVLGVLEK